MIDNLLLEERVKNTIQLGESHFREFKSAFEGQQGNKNPRPVTESLRLAVSKHGLPELFIGH